MKNLGPLALNQFVWSKLSVLSSYLSQFAVAPTVRRSTTSQSHSIARQMRQRDLQGTPGCFAFLAKRDGKTRCYVVYVTYDWLWVGACTHLRTYTHIHRRILRVLQRSIETSLRKRLEIAFLARAFAGLWCPGKNWEKERKENGRCIGLIKPLYITFFLSFSRSLVSLMFQIIFFSSIV